MSNLSGKDQQGINTSNSTRNSQANGRFGDGLDDKVLQNPANPFLRDEIKFLDRDMEPQANCKQKRQKVRHNENFWNANYGPGTALGQHKAQSIRRNI